MDKTNSYLKIKSKTKYFIFLCLYFVLFPFAKILYGRKNRWIICERGNDAQDNGFVFFRYLIINHPEIKCVYAIDKKSTDYKKVNQLGKTVQFCSFKHLLMTIGSSVKISTHLFGYSPWTQLTTYYRRNNTIDKHVFLQHGIIKNYHPGFLRENCKSLSLFVCGAKPEYEYVLKAFNYNNFVPQYTGLPRYDLLDNLMIKKQIIVMPTWRANLINLSDEEFSKTDYYQCWNKFLQDRFLISLALTNKMSVKFYLHKSFQKYTHLFKPNDAVEIVNYENKTVQELLKESKILITDYSSVYFDFAYLNKPVVYYQFDEKDYYNHHYEKGYFDYRNDGFGDVCVEEKTVIESIKNIIENNYCLEDKYSKRISRFFEYRDHNNCDRVFESIKRLINGK